MKHVFIVHSPITYLSALGVILKENLNQEDIMILSETYNSKDLPIKIICLEEKLNKFAQNSILKKFYNFPLKKMNQCLETFLEGDSFIAYVSVFVATNRFLIFHKNCASFNFIEEGLAAYHTYFDVKEMVTNTIGRWDMSFSFSNLKIYIKEILWSTFQAPSKISAIPTHYTAYATIPNICYYGFTEYSFPIAKNKKTISMKDIVKNYRFTPQLRDKLDNAYIWIGDPEIYSKFQNLDIYLQSIYDGYIVFLKERKINTTFVKFHYRERKEHCKLIVDLFEKYDINCIVLEDVIMEIELSESKNVTLVGFYSSLLLYAKLIGHNAYSIIDFTPLEINNLIDENKIPIFWSLIDKLQREGNQEPF